VSAVLEERPPALPAGWYWTTMGEIAEVVGGGTPRTTDPTNFQGGDIPWITPADLSGYAEKYIARGARFITQKGLESSSARLLPAGTVLFTSRAPIGYVAIARNALATNQGFKSFVLKDCVLPEYVYWWLKGSKQRAEALASGTTFLELSGANAKRLPIPVAPMDEQRRIVAELEKQFSRLDEAVANLKRVKANLKRYKAAVLKAAVQGRLVLTDAELARREARNCESGMQLLARILQGRRSQAKGNHKEPAEPDIGELPALPEGWVWGSAEQCCASVRDGTHDTPAYVANGIPLVTSKNLLDTGIDFDNTKHISEADHTEISRRSGVTRGDVLFAMIGTIGNPTEVRTDRPFSIKNVGLFKGDNECLSPAYLCYWLNSPALSAWLRPRLKGTTQKFAPLGLLRQLPIALPPRSEQDRIVAEVDRQLSTVSALEQSVSSEAVSKQLRMAILHEAFRPSRDRGPPGSVACS
jgi:type I restriction enzyme S subunit